MFFSPSCTFHLMDMISNLKKLPKKDPYEIWIRFQKILVQCQNHKMTEEDSKDTLYRALNSNTKPIIDNVMGSAFMAFTFIDVTLILHRLMKKNRASYIKNSNISSDTYVVSMSVEQH